MIFKRLFDIVASLLGLLLIWWIFPIVAFLIHKKMPGGPAFFCQKRVGKDGKLFTCHKFRSMTVKHSGSSVSVAGDSRITPFGAKLRHYKIDELPELWDVLIGNMSFVGPRPDVPGYADKLQGEDRDVLRLRPGITGPATLKYRLEDEMISEYVAKKQAEGDTRPMQEIAIAYNCLEYHRITSHLFCRMIHFWYSNTCLTSHFCTLSLISKHKQFVCALVWNYQILWKLKWNPKEMKRVFSFSGFDAFDDFSKDDRKAIQERPHTRVVCA
jgi:lipopolysaccharide/colanic/teichoic acid biosynthesis glycosyltransferase